jgi:hypothetical protein
MNIYRVQFKRCGMLTGVYWGVAEDEKKAIELATLFSERITGDDPRDLEFKLCELVEECDFGPPGVGHADLYSEPETT